MVYKTVILYDALWKSMLIAQRSLWVLVGTVFRRVDRYIQPQRNDDSSMAESRRLLKDAFDALLAHVTENAEAVLEVRNLRSWSKLDCDGSASSFLPYRREDLRDWLSSPYPAYSN